MPKHTDRTVSRRVQLSSRVAVDITFSMTGIVCEWDPEPPKDLTPSEFLVYRSARNACASELAAILGGNIVMGDLSSTGDSVSDILCFYPDGRIEQVRNAE